MTILRFSKKKLLLFITLFVLITLIILFGLYSRRLDNNINFRSCINSIESAIANSLKTNITLKNDLKIDNDGRLLSIEEINRVFEKIPLNTNFDCNQIDPINDKRIKDLDYLVVYVKAEKADIIVNVKFKQ